VLSTSDGNVGVALCWEFVRSRTAVGLKNKVGMVVGGSCWGGVEDTAPAADPLQKWLVELLQTTSGRCARLLGVPVVHASRAGLFAGGHGRASAPSLIVSGFPRCPPKKSGSGRNNSRVVMNSTCPRHRRL